MVMAHSSILLFTLLAWYLFTYARISLCSHPEAKCWPRFMCRRDKSSEAPNVSFILTNAQRMEGADGDLQVGAIKVRKFMHFFNC